MAFTSGLKDPVGAHIAKLGKSGPESACILLSNVSAGGAVESKIKGLSVHVNGEAHGRGKRKQLLTQAGRSVNNADSRAAPKAWMRLAAGSALPAY